MPGTDAVALAHDGGTLRVWNTVPEREPTLVREYPLELANLSTSSIRAHVSRALLVDEHGQVRLLEFDTGTLSTPFAELVLENPRALAFSSDGVRVATADARGGLRLWDGRTGALLATLDADLDEVGALAFAAGGTRLIALERHSAPKLWNAVKGELITTLEGDGLAVAEVAVSQNGDRVATLAFDSVIRLWHAHDGRLIDSFVGQPSAPTHGRFSPSGEQLAVASGDGTVRVWTIEPVTEQEVIHARGRQVFAVAFSPDRSRLAQGEQGLVSMWNTSSGALEFELEHDRAKVLCAAFSPDGSMLATGDSEGLVRLWSAGDGSLIRALPDHPAKVFSIAFSPDGQVLATGDANGRVQLRPLVSPAPTRTWELGDNASAMSLSFSPDGSRLAIAGGTVVVVRDLQTGEMIGDLGIVEGSALLVSFAPDGQRIAYAGDELTPRIWALDGAESSLSSIDSGITALGFSPDGERILTGGDVQLRLSDVATGEMIAELDRPDALPRGIVFTPDGRWIVSVSAAGAVARIPATAGHRFELACESRSGLCNESQH